VNGDAGFRADVTVTDKASGDTFRVVVTDASGSVVYDSGVQRVQGQITVHR
jgi:hypothetical protein